MGDFNVVRILRDTRFLKVRKPSVERKIIKVLNQGKVNFFEGKSGKIKIYNIAGRNMSGLCDLNDDFLNIKRKVVEKSMAVCGGWFSS